MANPVDEPLHLTRIDPERNMARFYMLSLQPTLFGDISVVRNWGRIGTGGRTKVETFDEAATARSACDRLHRSKRQRGYR